MISSSKDLAMKENGKSMWRARALLSKENRGGVEAGETSFRVYYGQNGAAVPFMWESQPGTPKHPLSKHSNDLILPPLTPPPSYHSSSSFSSSSTSSRKTRRSRILSIFLSSVASRGRSHVTPTSPLSYSDPYSLSTSSSSLESVYFSSSNNSGRNKHRPHRRSLSIFSTPRANKFPLFDDDENEQEEEVAGSPTNTSKIICFGFKKQVCYSIKGIKNATLFNKEHWKF